MKNFKDILVIVEGVGPEQAVLHKALRIAQRAKANLTIIANEQDKEIEHYIEWIYQKKLAMGELAKPQFDINIKYSRHPLSHQAILAEITNNNYDLLIKNIHTAKVKWGILRSDNHYLLREGNTNLLLVGENKWPDNGHILSALETEETAEKHQQLNRFMLDESHYLAQLLESDVHLINCYQEQPSISLADSFLAEGAVEPPEQHWQHLENTASRLGVQQDHIHVEAGLPEYVIPHEAEKYQINVVVLGAGEHHGFISLLKGHSSEYIVDALMCDALILKANVSNLH